MIILALDGLELSLVEKFSCEFLKQDRYGNTNIKEFSLPKTVILWASFLTGRNMESEVKEDLWTFKVKPEQTFLKKFKNSKAIDLPAFSYGEEHRQERELLKEFFVGSSSESIIETYNQIAWKNHKKTKKIFFEELKKNHDLLIGYFALSDVIGHLNFGSLKTMENVYQELNELAYQTKKIQPAEKILITSDHGMKEVGRFGDHTMAGFYSLNFDAKISRKPKITEFYDLIFRHN